MPNKSVTLYLTDEAIAILSDFCKATHRNKSMGAEFLIRHGAINYDIKPTQPRRVVPPMEEEPEPVAKKPAARKPAAKKQAARKPAAKKPAARKKRVA